MANAKIQRQDLLREISSWHGKPKLDILRQVSSAEPLRVMDRSLPADKAERLLGVLSQKVE